ncbi:MAG: exosortase, partial [Burkholderiales bacterium]
MKLDPVAFSSTAMPGQGPDVLRYRRIAAALVLSAVFWLLAWYGDTVQSMVATWQRSDTFAHGFLIAPISAWMIWRKRHAVAALDLRPDFRVLPLLALAGFGWLLGQLAGAGVAQQFGVVLMIPLLVWVILGTAVVRTLAFPLCFLLFAVPFGEFLELPLMEHTADFTVAALRLTGIPVYREGQFF